MISKIGISYSVYRPFKKNTDKQHQIVKISRELNLKEFKNKNYYPSELIDLYY